jgi:hypothetical protein
VWQKLHEELGPLGLDIVTIALDTNPEAARPFAEQARATHLSLVDPALLTVALFGFTNVPFGLWIDETGTIVRPAEVAFPSRGPDPQSQSVVANLPEETRRVVEGMTANLGDTRRYTGAVRDWVAHGSKSRFVLSSGEVLSHSRPLPAELGLAAAEFELGQYLHRRGHGRDAVAHFQRAHRLDPQNWSYKREAYSLVDPAWGPVYEQDLLSDVATTGPDTFYPALDM